MSKEDEALALEALEKESNDTMSVKVYAPFEVFYDGVGTRVSAVNAVGPFDILPRHKNFLCMLVPCDIVIDAPEGKQIIPVKRALMHVKTDRVVVFVNV